MSRAFSRRLRFSSPVLAQISPPENDPHPGGHWCFIPQGCQALLLLRPYPYPGSQFSFLASLSSPCSPRQWASTGVGVGVEVGGRSWRKAYGPFCGPLLSCKPGVSHTIISPPSLAFQPHCVVY